MLPTIRSFFLASLLLIAVPGCRGGPQSSVSAETAVEQFYSSYRGDFTTADRAFLSAALADAIATAMATEKTSAARMRASDTPHDKPDLIEGEIFAGLYEGYTEFQVGVARVDGGRAWVPVTFTNGNYHVQWTDEVVLVHEHGWKIDDVAYGRTPTAAPGLRATLQGFDDLAAPR